MLKRDIFTHNKSYLGKSAESNIKNKLLILQGDFTKKFQISREQRDFFIKSKSLGYSEEILREMPVKEY